MTRTLLSLFVVPLALLCASAAAAQEGKSAKPRGDDAAAAKLADARRLLEVSGTGKLASQVATQIVDQQRRALPQVPADFWTEFEGEVDAAQLIEMMAPVYDRHFTHDEIRALIAFYQSPAGQKLVQVQPLLARDSMLAGQQWGFRLGQRLTQRLKERGHVKR